MCLLIEASVSGKKPPIYDDPILCRYTPSFLNGRGLMGILWAND